MENEWVGECREVDAWTKRMTNNLEENVVFGWNFNYGFELI